MSELGTNLSRLKKINLNKQKSVEIKKSPIGIKTPLEKGNKTSETLFKMNFDILDQIEDNLKNLILTQKGQRLGFPDFGTNIRSLYSQNTISEEDVAEIVSVEIQEAVSKYMPSLKLINFYSQRISSIDSSLKENYSNINANNFLNQQSEISISQGTAVEINKNRKEKSIFKINVRYSIPGVLQEKLLEVYINSSK
jgi:phage baseplate assembly protein W